MTRLQRVGPRAPALTFTTPSTRLTADRTQPPRDRAEASIGTSTS